MRKIRILIWVPAAIFAIFFVSGPLTMLQGFVLMPGNIGDARLNNYFLENIYLFFSGKSSSLWHLPFFWPFPYVGGFSDNLFGSSPAYLAGRAFGLAPDTAFQVWFLFGYLVNFIACYYSLRKLKVNVLSASIGAAIFTFALPVSTRCGHPQLHYRFGVPLAITMLILALEGKSWRLLASSFAWLVWQFFCSIYIGVFTAFIMVLVALTWMLSTTLASNAHGEAHAIPFRLREFTKAFQSWTGLNSRTTAVFVVLVGLMCLLFYPYLIVSKAYGFARDPSEIASMLPRIASYLLCDASKIWGTDFGLFDALPMRHEHQMLFGFGPLMLALIGVAGGMKRESSHYFTSCFAGLLGAFMLTLSVAGVSVWLIAAQLPLLSAIRAVTRIDMVMLFPLAYFASLGAQRIGSVRLKGTGFALLALILLLMIVEFAAVSPATSSKESWRERLARKHALIPTDYPQDGILFFAQQGDPFYAEELDAMWLAQKIGLPTLNGYSGNIPHGYSHDFGTDINELPRRVLLWLKFANRDNGQDDYLNLIKRVMPIGFSEQAGPHNWETHKPQLSLTPTSYTPEELQHFAIQTHELRVADTSKSVPVEIKNTGPQDIVPASASGNPIRLSWRFVNDGEGGEIGWQNRKDIPFDIPAGGSVHVQLPLGETKSRPSDIVEISIVHEGKFWLHDHGVRPVQVNLERLPKDDDAQSR